MGSAASAPYRKSTATMRGFGRRIASEVTTAIITIALAPDVQPVHSQKSVPSTHAIVVRQKFTIAWWRSADSALMTTSLRRISSSIALILVLLITPRLRSR
ncbi:hypothetical protein D3C81_1649070 [compost metagenome]